METLISPRQSMASLASLGSYQAAGPLMSHSEPGTSISSADAFSQGDVMRETPEAPMSPMQQSRDGQARLLSTEPQPWQISKVASSASRPDLVQARIPDHPSSVPRPVSCRCQ